MLLFGYVATWLSSWLTPVWLLGLGALVGLVVLLILWGVLGLVSRHAAREVPLVIGEGVLLPILLVCATMALFGAVGFSVVQDPGEHFYSLHRLLTFSVGTEVHQLQIAAPSPESEAPVAQEIAVTFHGDELRKLSFSSEENLHVTTPPEEDGSLAQSWAVTGGEELQWLRGAEATHPLFGQEYDRLLVYNDGQGETTLRLTIVTAPVHPEVATVLITAISVIGVVLIYLIMRAATPKVAAIALATVKSEMSQPLFLILLIVGVFLLLLFMYLPYYTFDEDIKVLKDSGLTLIMVFCIFQAIWAASTSVADELEGRTALTVLSKPISRRQFILGKFAGIIWTVAVMFIILGVVFLVFSRASNISGART